LDVDGNMLTRRDGFSWTDSGYVAGNPYGKGPQHVWVDGVSYTITGFANADCRDELGIGDPWPDCGKNSVMLLGGSPGASTVGDIHVLVPVKITTTGPMEIHTTYLRFLGGAFAASFKVGQQVTITGLAGPFTISGFSPDRSIMYFHNVALRPTVKVVNHVAVWYAPMLTVTGLDPLQDGGTMIGGDTINVCQDTAKAYLGTPCGTVLAGPNSPLVIHGDTTQDGTWYAGHPYDSLGYEFGP
jgi:hypothetical protein